MNLGGRKISFRWQFGISDNTARSLLVQGVHTVLFKSLFHCRCISNKNTSHDDSIPSNVNRHVISYCDGPLEKRKANNLPYHFPLLCHVIISSFKCIGICSSRWKAYINTGKLNWYFSIITDVFLNQKRVNICEHSKGCVTWVSVCFIRRPLHFVQ